MAVNLPTRGMFTQAKQTVHTHMTQHLSEDADKVQIGKPFRGQGQSLLSLKRDLLFFNSIQTHMYTQYINTFN